MKALLWLCCVSCFVCNCCAGPQIRSLNSNSLIEDESADNYLDIPWLVSMPENCQGIVLTRSVILSTANCLKKSKLSHLDISGVNDPDSIPHGQRICLHPKFDPQDENDPVKADIGLVILEEPLYGNGVSISQSSNISLKSCSKCQYKICNVYEYQSSKKLGTTKVKKIDVQMLDFSTCHHQYSYLEKNEGLCIQSQPREDCWVQRASPVLCLQKNHWEMMGLVHKTSRICQNPTVVIRIAPYFAWMKQFIKASKKLLNSTSSLHCRTLQEDEHVPQIRHSHNYISSLALSNTSLSSSQENLGISPQIKNINNHPKILNLNDVHYFSDAHKLYLDKIQTPQADQMTPLPVARLPENSGQNSIQVTSPPNTSSLQYYPLSQLISDTASSTPKAGSAKPWNFTANNPEKSFDKIMADIIKQWSPSTDDEVEPSSFHDTNTTDDSEIENTNLDEYANILKAMTSGPHNQSTTQDNLAPNVHLSEKKRPWEFFTSGGAINQTGLPMESVDNTRIPQPTGALETLNSSPDNKANSYDQLVIDSVKTQNHSVSDADRLQIVPMANTGIYSTSKAVPYTSLPADPETKNPPYQVPYSTLPLQDQPSFKATIQPTIEIQPLLKAQSERTGHRGQS